MHRFTPLLGLCVLLVACGKAPDDTKASADSTASASAPVQELAPGAPTPAATAPKGPALLRVKATVKDDTYKNAPSCMVTFTVENLHDRPLAVFSADFVPMQASTNKELTTATHFAGMSASAANLPLEPGASGQPWKQNILGTGCSDIAVRFEGQFMCSFPGRPCKPEEVEAVQEGLASLTGLGG